MNHYLGIAYFQNFITIPALAVIALIFFIPNPSTAQAVGIAKIKIEFPHQKNEPVKVGIYENLFVEDDCKTIVETVSDEKGVVNIDIPINTPSILISESIHGKFRFYIRPGETLKVSIYNARNIKFEGASENLNRYLFDNGFISEVFNLDRYDKPFTVDSVLSKINRSYEKKTADLNEFKSNIDFFNYAKGETIGGTYMDFIIFKNALKNKKDTLGELKVDQHIDSFIKNDFTFMDETRSRRYINTLSMCDSTIKVFEKIKGDTSCEDFHYWKNFSGHRKFYLMNTCCEYPKVYELFHYASVNSRIFTAKDSLSLSLAKRDLTWLLEKRSESVYLEALLTSRYQEKKRQISLIDPYFFIAQQADAIPFMLSQKKGAIIVIDFWATWCKPCIAALPEFSKAAEQNTNPGIIFIAANTSDDREKWADFSKEHNISKSIFNIWLSPSESKKVYEAYYFDTLPHYVIIGKESTFLLKGARKFAEEVLPVLKNIK